MNTEVVVVGGGVVGAAAAYQLARLGVKVTLVDAEQEGYATAAGAGIVAPGCSVRPAGPYYPLAYKAAAYYPTLLSQLADDGQSETGYEVIGSLFVATSEAELDKLTILERLFQDRAVAGVPNMGIVSMLTQKEAQQLFPPIGDVAGAIHMSGGARLNGRLLRSALRQASIARGTSMVNGSADLVCEGGRVKGVIVNGQHISADIVIACGGAWSNQFRTTTGIEIPVKPQKGQIIHLEMKEDTSRWPIVEGFHSHYMLTFPEHRVVVGATREDDSGYDTRVTAAGMQEVLNEALRIAPGLGSGTLLEVRVGLRPDTPDHMPILGPVPGISGLFLATGHGAGGLNTGAYSGIAVASQALLQPMDVDLEPFSITRFQ